MNLLFKDYEWTDMVRADGVDLLNFIAESHGLIREQLHELVGCRFSSKQLELLVYCSSPSKDDASRDLGRRFNMNKAGSMSNLTIIAPIGSNPVEMLI